MSTILEAALAVAAAGYPVFPTNDKVPSWSNDDLGVAQGQGGYHVATTDPTRIRFLFDHLGAHEIAVPMGEMSGLICVDADIYKSVDAQLWVGARKHLLWETRVHKTRSGGLHFIFQHPGNQYRFPATLALGIDLKAAGNGYICWPGTPGYSEINDCTPPAPFPLELLEEAMRAKGGDGSITTATGTYSDDTDEDLMGRIVDASDLYPALRSLSIRLPNRKHEGKYLSQKEQLEILEGVMDESEAKSSQHPRHDAWVNRRGKIEGLVTSANRKTASVNIPQHLLDMLSEGTPVMEVPYSENPTEATPVTKEDIERRVEVLQTSQSDDDSEFVTFDLNSLQAEKLPPIPWVIEGMLPAGGISSLAGDSNVGKTRWLALLAVCLNGGCTEEMGLPPCKPESVLWIANEEHTDDIKRRVKAAHAHYDAVRMNGTTITVRPKTEGTFRLVTVNEFGQPEVDEEALARLVAEVLETGARVVFLDPYVTLSDAADENSASSAGKISEALLILTSLTGAAVLHAHHTPKDRSKPHDWYRGDSGAWRGSGAIYSALDCGFTLANWMPAAGPDRKEWSKRFLNDRLSRWVVLDSGKIREGSPLLPVVYELLGQEIDEGYEIGVTHLSSEAAADSVIVHGSVDMIAVITLGTAIVKTLGEGTHTFAQAHRQMEGHEAWVSDADRLKDGPRDELLAMFGEGVICGGYTVRADFDATVKNKATQYTLTIEKA